MATSDDVAKAVAEMSLQEQEAKYPLADFPKEQIAEVNGEKYAYYTYNSSASEKPAQLILLHGNQTASRCFREIMGHPRLSKTKAIAVDLRGFGNTSYNTELRSHDDLTKDLAELMGQLGLKNCTFLCWSTGGAPAANLAASHPELVAGLVFMSSIGPNGYHMTKEGKDKSERVPCTNKDEVGMELSFFLQSYAGNTYEPFLAFWDKVVWDKSFVSAERRKEFGEDILQQRNLVDIAWLNHIYDAIKSGVAEKIKAKVLILHGSADMVVKESNAKDWAKLLPSAKLHIIKGGNHCLFLGHRDELCGAVADFLGQ